jgi:hypothetical protein
MRGQDWLDGDEVFHRLLNVATLLVYGVKDQLVSLEDEQDMEKVWRLYTHSTTSTCSMPRKMLSFVRCPAE